MLERETCLRSRPEAKFDVATKAVSKVAWLSSSEMPDTFHRFWCRALGVLKSFHCTLGHWGLGVWATVASRVCLWVFGSVLGRMCGLQCLCSCVRVWSGAEQKRTLIGRVGVCRAHSEREREAGFHLHACLLIPQWGPHARVKRGILLCD